MKPPAKARRVVMGGTGSPECLYLDEFGSQVWNVFGGPPYHVGSSTTSKKWRDVDVRMILSDEEWKQWGLGDDPKRPNAKWATLCMAFSELGRKMTGLPIDFQIQQQTDANERNKGIRLALGCLELREACKRCLSKKEKGE